MSASSDPMRDRVCVVTGATAGIGLVTARELARMGATVAIVARDEGRARAVVAAIREQTGDGRVDYLLADLAVQAQVRRLAGEIAARYPRLHVLLNNAGSVFVRRRETPDGLEMTFALNHLAPFLLTNLLLDTLKAGAPARILTVSSAAHGGARLDFDDLQQTRRPYWSMRAYGQSKLATLLFTHELARRLEGTGVTANALHPGFVASNFGRRDNPVLRLVMPLLRPFAIGEEEGARTSVYLASAPEVEGISGEYFVKCRAVRSDPASYDAAAARRLWEVSARLTGLEAPA